MVTGPFAEMYLHFTPGLKEVGEWDVKARRAVSLGDNGTERVSLTTYERVSLFRFRSSPVNMICSPRGGWC